MYRMAEPVQRHFTTNSINEISHVIQLARSYQTDLTCACSAFRVLSGHNTLYSVHVLLDFSTSCHVLIRHVMPLQIAARSLFARRTHSPDNMMWWRAATGQNARGEARRVQLRTPPTQSILEPGHINFENHTHK